MMPCRRSGPGAGPVPCADCPPKPAPAGAGSVAPLSAFVMTTATSEVLANHASLMSLDRLSEDVGKLDVQSICRRTADRPFEVVVGGILDFQHLRLCRLP